MPYKAVKCVYQCPQCGALINFSRNEMTQRLEFLKARHLRLIQDREKLAEEHASDNSFEFRAKFAKLKTEIMVAEHAARCVRAELTGNPVQMWQNRYEKALALYGEMHGASALTKFREALDEACRPKELR